MKKLLVSLFLLIGMGTAYAQYGSSSGQYGQYGQQQQQQGQQQQGQQQMQQQSATPSDCSHLSQQEQQFASQLSTMHRTMFCRHFSVSQRIEAMTLSNAGAQGLSGQQASISPDESVEIVMKNARNDQSGNSQQQQPAQQQSSPYGGGYSYPSHSQSSPYSN